MKNDIYVFCGVTAFEDVERFINYAMCIGIDTNSIAISTNYRQEENSEVHVAVFATLINHIKLSQCECYIEDCDI